MNPQSITSVLRFDRAPVTLRIVTLDAETHSVRRGIVWITVEFVENFCDEVG